MPTFPPRSEAIKKKEELAKWDYELKLAIQKKFTLEKKIAAVENYRKAQLSLLKAQLHVVREKEFQKKKHALNTQKIASSIQEWTNKTNEQILQEFQ